MPGLWKGDSTHCSWAMFIKCAVRWQELKGKKPLTLRERVRKTHVLNSYQVQCIAGRFSFQAAYQLAANVYQMPQEVRAVQKPELLSDEEERCWVWRDLGKRRPGRARGSLTLCRGETGLAGAVFPERGLVRVRKGPESACLQVGGVRDAQDFKGSFVNHTALRGTCVHTCPRENV